MRHRWMLGGIAIAAGMIAGCSLNPSSLLKPTGPVITALDVPTGPIAPGTVYPLKVTVRSGSSDRMTYAWDVSGGIVSDPRSASPSWISPGGAIFPGSQIKFSVVVTDDSGRQDHRDQTVAMSTGNN